MKSKKQINNITLAEAEKIALKHKFKFTFTTPPEDVKAFARKILRNERTIR